MSDGAGTPGRDASPDGSRGRVSPSCAAVMSPASETISARSIAFWSSRMFPGHGYVSSSSRASRQPRLPLAHPLAQAADEFLGEEHHVLAALAQRRQVNRKHAEPVVEILT